MDKKLPYYTRDVAPLLGDETLYNRMAHVFDLVGSPVYEGLGEMLAVMDSDAPLVVGSTSKEISGSEEVLEIYSEGFYLFMLYDWTRTVAYENALAGHLRRNPKLRRTLEIGCGAYPVLSWMLYEAGATDLTVCEVKETSFASARDRFAKALPHVELGDKVAVLRDDRGAQVTLHNRYSTELELAPDEKFDLYVQEIVGPIASMEGCVDVFNQTLPMLADDAVCVPRAMRSYCAPVRRFDLAPDNQARLARMREISPELEYTIPSEPTITIGTLHGMLSVSKDALIAPPQVFEDFDFTVREPLPLTGVRTLRFTPEQATALDGLVIYVEVDTDADNRFDSLTSAMSWFPFYVRLFEQPLDVEPGTHEIRVVAEHDVSIANMFYAFDVTVLAGGEVVAAKTVRLQLS